jgi:hypothetical protein
VWFGQQRALRSESIQMVLFIVHRENVPYGDFETKKYCDDLTI